MENMKETAIYMSAIWVVSTLFFGSLLYIIFLSQEKGIWTDTRTDEERCEGMDSLALRNLPARCLKFYEVK